MLDDTLTKLRKINSQVKTNYDFNKNYNYEITEPDKSFVKEQAYQFDVDTDDLQKVYDNAKQNLSSKTDLSTKQHIEYISKELYKFAKNSKSKSEDYYNSVNRDNASINSQVDMDLLGMKVCVNELTENSRTLFQNYTNLLLEKSRYFLEKNPSPIVRDIIQKIDSSRGKLFEEGNRISTLCTELKFLINELENIMKNPNTYKGEF